MSESKLVREIEQRLDAAILAHRYFKDTRLQHALRYLLIAHEELLFNLWRTNTPMFEGMVDRSKLALMFGYRWCRSACTPVREYTPTGYINGARYKLARDVFGIALQYDAIETAYMHYTDGHAEAEVIDDHTVRFTLEREELRYFALGECEKGLAEAVQLLTTKPKLSSTGRKMLEELRTATRRSGATGITYPTPPVELLEELRDFAEAFDPLPDAWSFRGLNGGQYHEFGKAVGAICALHQILNSYAAETLSQQCIVPTLVMERSPKGWGEAILPIAPSLSADDVEAIIQLLTYESSVDELDPALQPFLPLGKDNLLLGPFLYTTSNFGRNLLQHLAVNHAADFDPTTEVFHYGLLRGMEEALAGGTYKARTSVKIPGRPDLPDVDLAVHDPATGLLVLTEVKWTIGCGEAGETWRRGADREAKGLEQAHKLLDYARAEPDQLWRTLFGKAPQPPELDVRAAVAMKGFHGTSANHDPDVPVVSYEMYMSTITRSEDLAKSMDEMRRREYMPVEGEHFEVTKERVTTVAGFNVMTQGFFLL